MKAKRIEETGKYHDENKVCTKRIRKPNKPYIRSKHEEGRVFIGNY